VATRGEPPTPGFLVWRLSMKWRTAVDRSVAELGLPHAQYSLLAALHGMQRAGLQPSQRQLADQTGLEPIYVSKLVQALSHRGLLERKSDPRDARAVQLTLTRRGREIAERAIAIVLELQQQLTAPIGGVGSTRTRAFVRELEALLAAPTARSTKGATR
jgi:MarR family transcriptional regulator, organic hydroperoxide resistance regulator